MRTVAAEVNPAIFTQGRQVAVAGSKAQVNWVRDDQSSPLENIAGLWSQPIEIDQGFRRSFDSSFGSAGNPVTTMFVSAKNAGTPGDTVSLMSFTEVAANNGSGFGANFGVFSSSGATNYKLQGMEIDLLPQAGTTWLSGGGMVLNVFTMQSAGPAFYFEGLSGGKWSTGVQAGNLSDIGAGLSPAPAISGTPPRMGTLIDSGVATYVIDFIKANNGHKIQLQGTASAHAKIYNGSGNTLRLVGGSSGIEIRNNADGATTLSIGDGALGNYANDAAAATGGVAVSQAYRNGSALMVRVT